jgi:hypothetical protein
LSVNYIFEMNGALLVLVCSLLLAQVLCQFENMFESQMTASRKRRKKPRKEKSGVEGALIRSGLLSRAVEELEMNLERYHLWWTGPPEDDIFKPAAWGAMHRENIPAIFTMAVIQGFQDVHLSDPHDLILWLGTCRRFFEGDIVIAIEGKLSSLLCLSYIAIIITVILNLIQSPLSSLHLHCSL